MTGKRDSQWRLDLQSVLHETNQLTISASENSINTQNIANIPKKYKKKKVHDDRLVTLFRQRCIIHQPRIFGRRKYGKKMGKNVGFSYTLLAHFKYFSEDKNNIFQ